MNVPPTRTNDPEVSEWVESAESVETNAPPESQQFTYRVMLRPVVPARTYIDAAIVTPGVTGIPDEPPTVEACAVPVDVSFTSSEADPYCANKTDLETEQFKLADHPVAFTSNDGLSHKFHRWSFEYVPVDESTMIVAGVGAV